ncbi:MAG: hypothetical protein ACPGUV_11450 [Polyangiales bacterium]
MTRLHVWMQALVLASGVGATACGASKPMEAELAYRVTCASSACNNVTRSFLGEDGDEDTRVDCSLFALEAQGALVLDFQVQNDEYGVEVRDALWPLGSAVLSPGNTCSVTYTESSVNRFTGSCGSDALGPQQPCRMADLSISDEPEGETVRGSLFCRNLPQESDATRTRDLSDPAAAEQAFSFRFLRCRRTE